MRKSVKDPIVDIVHIGEPPIEVRLRRSARAKRYSLRISNSDGTISLTIPSRASERAAIDFAERQEGWLRNALAKRPAMEWPEFGGSLLFEGRMRLLVETTGRRINLNEETLEVPGTSAQLPAKLSGFLKVSARERLADATEYFADQLGKSVTRITLRDTKSRWGSCTTDGKLMYSWRLVMAPPKVLQYVAAHEVAHLVEMNHAPQYWSVVRGLMPDFELHRRWLKDNSVVLHRYQFKPR